MLRVFLALTILFLNCGFASHSIETMNEKWKVALAETPPYPEDAFHGRGIVIAAGGAKYLQNAWVLVNILRDYQCSLPIEIWYIGKKEYITKFMKGFEKMGVMCKDITHYFDNSIQSFEVKIHAILASQFQEVLLLDADNVPLQDPSFLFDAPAYTDTGALFWPDMQVLNKEHPIFSILELEPLETRCQESGQIVLDKERCWEPLQLCLHLNQESSYYYKILLGDKDTFFLSWMTLDYPFTMIDTLPGLAKKSKIRNGFIAFLQRDTDGTPLFCHSVNKNWAQRSSFHLMWNYYALPEQPAQQTDPPYPFKELKFAPFSKLSFGLEKKCLKYLNEAKSFLEKK